MCRFPEESTPRDHTKTPLTLPPPSCDLPYWSVEQEDMRAVVGWWMMEDGGAYRDHGGGCLVRCSMWGWGG